MAKQRNQHEYPFCCGYDTTRRLKCATQKKKMNWDVDYKMLKKNFMASHLLRSQIHGSVCRQLNFRNFFSSVCANFVRICWETFKINSNCGEDDETGDNSTVNIRLESKWETDDADEPRHTNKTQHIQPAHNRKLNRSKSKHHRTSRRNGRQTPPLTHMQTMEMKKKEENRTHAHDVIRFGNLYCYTLRSRMHECNVATHVRDSVDMDTDTDNRGEREVKMHFVHSTRLHVAVEGCSKIDAACSSLHTKCSRFMDISHCIDIICMSFVDVSV